MCFLVSPVTAGSGDVCPGRGRVARRVLGDTSDGSCLLSGRGSESHRFLDSVDAQTCCPFMAFNLTPPSMRPNRPTCQMMGEAVTPTESPERPLGSPPKVTLRDRHCGFITDPSFAALLQECAVVARFACCRSGPPGRPDGAPECAADRPRSGSVPPAGPVMTTTKVEASRPCSHDDFGDRFAIAFALGTLPLGVTGVPWPPTA